MIRTDFNSDLEVYEHFSDDSVCRDYIEKFRWGNNPFCAHCGHEKVYRYSDGRTLRCASCKKKFSVLKGTIFERSNIPLKKWMVAMYRFMTEKKGISSCQLSRNIGVTQKTAWHMLHRLRELIKEKDPEMLSGHVEADETYVGGKAKNNTRKLRAERTQGRSTSTKTPVFGATERNGNLILRPVPNTKKMTLHNLVDRFIKKDSLLYTDEYKSYNGLKPAYVHRQVQHKIWEYVKGEVHTNSIEGAFGNFKRMLNGTYHQISPKHIRKYCDEYAFRYNTRKMKDDKRFIIALVMTEGRSLPYDELTASDP